MTSRLLGEKPVHGLESWACAFEVNLVAQAGSQGCHCLPAPFLGGTRVQLRQQRVPLLGVPNDPRQVVAPGPVPRGVVALRALHAAVA